MIPELLVLAINLLEICITPYNSAIYILYIRL